MNSVYFDNATLGQQEYINSRIRAELYACQTMLVGALIQSGMEGFTSEDIENTLRDKETFEWWLCSSWLCDALRDMGEIVIDNDYGCWWGRSCTGQAIALDATFWEIFQNGLSEID